MKKRRSNIGMMKKYIGVIIASISIIVGLYQPNVIYGESEYSESVEFYLDYIEMHLKQWESGDLQDGQLCRLVRGELSYRFDIGIQLGTIEAGFENGFDMHEMEVLKAGMIELYEQYGAESMLSYSLPISYNLYYFDGSAATIVVDPSILELTEQGIESVAVSVCNVLEGVWIELPLEALRPILEEGTFEIQVNKMNKNKDIEICIFDPVSVDITRGEKDITLSTPIKLIYECYALSLHEGDYIIKKNGVGEKLIRNNDVYKTIECDVQEAGIYQLDFSEKNYAFDDLGQLGAFDRVYIQEIMSMELMHGINDLQFRPSAVMTHGEFREILSQFTNETVYYEHADRLNFYEAMKITAELLRSFGLEEPKEDEDLHFSNNFNTDGFSIQDIRDLQLLKYYNVIPRAMYQEDFTFESDFTRLDTIDILNDILSIKKYENVDIPMNILGDRLVYNYEALVLHDLGLFDGVSQETFVPDLFGTVNREQALKMIGVALDWEIQPDSVSKFEDVSTWAQPYVKKAYELGITQGISETQFGGQNQVTGREVFTWLIRGLGVDSEEAWQNTGRYVLWDFDMHLSYSPDRVYDRNLMVKAIYEVLEKAPLDSDRTLIQQLVDHYPLLKRIAINHQFEVY